MRRLHKFLDVLHHHIALHRVCYQRANTAHGACVLLAQSAMKDAAMNGEMTTVVGTTQPLCWLV